MGAAFTARRALQVKLGHIRAQLGRLAQAGQGVVRRVGGRVLLVQENTRYGARSEDTAERLAARESFAESVLWAGDVAEETDDGAVVVERLRGEKAGIGYDATAVDEDGAPVRISGSYDSFTVSANAVFYLTESQISPYIGGGLGWTWIDTRIPNGPPYTWCWWDPWLGYVCSTSYPTETIDAFSYQALAGLRYTFDSDRSFVQLGYTSQWMDFDSASGTPRFDVIKLDFGWIF